MTSKAGAPEPYYIAYIDEAGDPGLTRVRPIDPNGASEWLALGAIVVRAESEPEIVQWVRDIRHEIKAHQGPDLHYRKLSSERKVKVCERVASLKLRSFALLSNKKNMRGYRNKVAEAYPGHAKVGSTTFVRGCC